MAKNSSPFSNLDDDTDELPSKGKEPGKDPDPVIDLDAEVEEDAEPELSRTEKKARRTWMNADERERLEREAAENRAAAAASAAALDRVTQALSRMAPAQQPAPQRSQIDDEIDRAAADRVALDREYTTLYQAGKLTETDAERLRARAIELESKQIDLRVQRGIQQNGGGQQVNPQQQAIVSYIVGRYPEASQNPQVMAYAEGIQRTLAATGKPAWAASTIDEAMDAAEKWAHLGKYKQGAPHAPDPVLRDRLAGAPRGSTGASEKEGGRTFTVTKEFRRMADKAFSHITDPAKRYRHAYKMTHEQGDE